MESDLERELCCGICLELFEKPLVLPCQHSFCSECIRSLAEKGCSDEKDNNIKFKCPMCLLDVHCLLGDFEYLPVNFTLSNIVERYKVSRHRKTFPLPIVTDSNNQSLNIKKESDHYDSQICSFCEDFDSNPQAVKVCINCDLTAYCLKCLANYHPSKGAFSKHHVVDIGSPLARKEQSRRETVCVAHNKHVTMFCMNCDILICNICVTERLHLSHDVKDISESFNLCKKWLTCREGYLDEYRKFLDDSKQKSLASVSDFVSKSQKMMSEISGQFKRLHNAVDKKEKEIFKELTFEKDAVKRNLEAKVGSIDIKMNELGKLVADKGSLMDENEFRFLKDFKALKSRIPECEVEEQQSYSTSFGQVQMDVGNCERSIKSLMLDWTWLPDVHNINLGTKPMMTSKKDAVTPLPVVLGSAKLSKMAKVPVQAFMKEAVFTPSPIILDSAKSSEMAQDCVQFVDRNTHKKKISAKPSLGFQAREIKSEMEFPLRPGDSWNLIETTWFTKWKKYVNFDFDLTGSGCHPGPVDNTHLLKKDGKNLRGCLIEGLNYIVLKEEGWEQMVSWYGVVEGQQPIKRTVVQEGLSSCSQNCRVEIYKIKLKFMKKGCTSFQRYFCHFDRIQTLIDTAKNMFKTAGKDIQLRDDKGSLLKSMELTLSDYNLKSGSSIRVEEQWPTLS